MPRSRLRVYYGPREDRTASVAALDASQPRRVRLPLGEILPLLADAIASERTWLSDFHDDEIAISTDLYEILLAYQHYRRPSA